MAEIFPSATETPGNLKRIGLGVENGNEEVYDLRVRHDAQFDGNLTCTGNLTLSSTSAVDVRASTIYTFSDPVINLNTSFTGTSIPEAGLDVFRGAGIDAGKLVLMENEDRSVVDWRVGLGTDLRRIGRVADSMSNRSPLYWENASKSLLTNSSIALNDTQITSTIPIQQTITAGSLSPLTQIVSDGSLKSEVQWYVNPGDVPGGATTEHNRVSFEPLTYGGTVWPNRASTISAKTAMYFKIEKTPAEVLDSRLRYVFDGIASLGLAGDGASILRTDNDILRLSGVDGVDLGVGDISKVSLTNTLLDVNVPMDLGSNLLTADSVDIGEVSADTLSHPVPLALNLFPTIPGWTPTSGTVPYNSITSSVTAGPASRMWSYRIEIYYTIAPGGGGPGTLLCPIYLGGSQSNLLSITGMHRLMSAPPPLGVPVVSYGLPSDSIWIQEPFDVDANITAARCAGYSFVMVNIRKRPGSWCVSLLATIHIP